MDYAGTRELKRSAKAAPPALEASLPVGCLAALAAYLGLWLMLVTVVPGAWSIAVGVPAVLIVLAMVGQYFYEVALLILVHLRWSSRGVRCLVVHSHSPKWEEHVRTKWLPRVGSEAVVLNWSERSTWRDTLAVRVFRHFCGQRRNFNPAVVVFRGLKRPFVFRFFYAFQQAEAGRSEYLGRLEAEMFRVLNINAPAA